MLHRLKSLFRAVSILLLLIVAAYAGWRWGPLVFPRVNQWLGLEDGDRVEAPAPTREMADSVIAGVQSFLRGEGPTQMALGGSDLTSVLQFSASGLIPAGVSNPRVTMRDGHLQLRARVALESFPDLPDLGPVLEIVPDTLDVAFQADLMPFGDGTAALLIHRVEAARIPLPSRIVPEILTAMGRKDRPGLPREALLVPLPSGVGSAYILNDSLILTHDS